MPTLKFKSSDGVIIETDVDFAKFSGTIKSMFDACGVTADVIPLPKVGSRTLRLILSWMKEHEDETVTENAATSEHELWDSIFIEANQEAIFELIAASHYLDIKDLLDLACKSVANSIAGKSVVEMKKILNIKEGE